MPNITQAFIFAAGRGERMKPITDSIPKPLVKVNNKALIDYIIEKLDIIPEIEKIIINGFYLADQIQTHIQKLNNPKIIFSKEIEKIETGGGLVFAQDKIDFNKPLLMFNSDVLSPEGVSDIQMMCDNWDPKNHDILLGLKKTKDFPGYHGKGDFDLESRKLFKRANKSMSHVFTGIQIINPQIIKKAPEKCFSMSYFYHLALKNDGMLNRVQGIELNNNYFHVGDIESIQKTEESLNLIASN